MFKKLGCGNGKYLNVKHSVFNVGVDRCKKLTDIARDKENEVRTIFFNTLTQKYQQLKLKKKVFLT